MENIKWSGYEWLPQERWGDMHIEKPEVWYDPSAIEIDSNEYLRLKARQAPKRYTCPNPDPDKLESCYSMVGIGLVSCTEKFKYGTFEIEAKLPKGPYTWPSFWMWSFESWPPEIDIFEAYSNKRGSYFNWSHGLFLGKFWRVATNIHLPSNSGNYDLGAKYHYYGFKNPSKHFIKYSMEWKPDKISIFYGDRLVRKITDEDTLSKIRGKQMNVILNNSVWYKYLGTDMPETEMVVKSFKYTPLQLDE
jgi:beta-glucanase (GH16 family)